MKILIITNRFVIGGPTNHIADLAYGLQDEFEIKIIGGVATKFEVINLDIFSKLKNEPTVIDGFSRKISLFNDLRSYIEIKKIIKEFKPDIVHTHTSKPGFMGRIAARRLHVKTIIHTFHGNIFDGYFNTFISNIIIKIEKYLAKRSTSIITLSEKQKTNIIERLNIKNSQKVNIIKIGIDTEKFSETIKSRVKFREKYSLKDNDIALGIVGRISEIKNIKLFIRGVKHLKDKGFDNVKGFIVGDGIEKQDLKIYCETIGVDYLEYGIGNNLASIIFTSWCYDVSKVYPGLDILALTSLNEGTPYSIIEAQLAGVAIIASNVGGVSNIVEEGKTALLFSEDAEFYSKLELLVMDKNLRDNLGSQAKIYAKNEFDLKLMIEKTKKLYLDLINR
ncbi:MAG: hypothetical protein AUJ98_07155 [Bacteroidetes bacterium CG2_30_33_31]|nr:MAG: hypothetical protein AUJ98_07155 [Bacteroidetes bacterium CG2_30_33_31]